MNKFKTFLKVLLSLILVAVITVSFIYLFYYPRYLSNKREILTSTPSYTEKISVMTYNIRCHAIDDLGKKSWFYRANHVADTIEKAEPTIIGFQEVTSWQYKYLCKTLTSFDSIITYRDNTPLYSEGCPLFYRTDLYSLVDKGSFWLSETPEVMSKDWGAACYRICTYAILKDKATEKEFVVFNTHLDHVSDEARIKGIQVVLDKIKQFGSIPAVLMGDLNASEDKETYIKATEYFLDAKYQTENTMSSCTYQNWGNDLNRPCIDYVMLTKDSFEVDSYKVITDTFDGVYASDHFPIVVSMELD
ncbi:MAG: endonuclease/exonuclease/phosphatase family protein [Acutalibacteraceae bacterium]